MGKNASSVVESTGSSCTDGAAADWLRSFIASTLAAVKSACSPERHAGSVPQGWGKQNKHGPGVRSRYSSVFHHHLSQIATGGGALTVPPGAEVAGMAGAERNAGFRTALT